MIKNYFTTLKVLFHIQMIIGVVFWTLFLTTFVSCGPSAEERYAMEQAQKDSLKQKGQDSTYYAESVFIIDNVREDQFKEFTQYHAVMSDNTTLGSAEFWFRAKAKKFKIGDPLILNFRSIEKPDTTRIVEKTSPTINKISK